MIDPSVSIHTVKYEYIKDLMPFEQLNFKKIVGEAEYDKYLNEGSRYWNIDKLKFILYKGYCAGFYNPSLVNYNNENRWRIGSIYIIPRYRGMGISEFVISEFYKDKKGVAYIADSNISSIKSFTRAGFISEDPATTPSGEMGKMYLIN